MIRTKQIPSSLFQDQRAKERFYAQLSEPLEPFGCRMWRGRKKEGIPIFGVYGSDLVASRVAFFLDTGTDPAESLILHGQCTNKLCCEPSHLRMGTDEENKRDQHDLYRFGVRMGYILQEFYNRIEKC